MFYVSALSAGAYTTTLYVRIDILKELVGSSPSLTILGLFYPHDGMYTRKWLLPLCVLCWGQVYIALALHCNIISVLVHNTLWKDLVRPEKI
jgi:hypothetical protein